MRTLLTTCNFFCCLHETNAICVGVLGQEDGSLGGAVAAVIAVHIVIGIYIYVAWSEDKSVKLDQQKSK